MAQRKTAIVGLGVEYYRCLTQVHTAEDLVGEKFPVKFDKEYVPLTIVDAAGNKFSYTLTVFRAGKAMNLGLVRSLLSRDELQEWKFRGTQLFLTFADIVTNRLVDAARNGITIYG